MKRYWLPPGAGGRVFGTRQPPSIQGDSTQLQRLFCSLAYSADKSWRSAESRMLQLIPPGTEMCSSSSAFWEQAGFFFCVFCFVFPLRGESLYEGGRFCLTPAMFAAGNESY